MGIADLDFKTAPEITKAIAERVLHDNWGYILTPDSYYESIVEWILKRYGERISREQLLLSTGVLPALDLNGDGIYNGTEVDSFITSNYVEPIDLEEHQSLELAYTGVIGGNNLFEVIDFIF